MAVDIGPRIGIDGEKEFKSSLSAITSELKSLGAEMQAVTSEFIGNEKSSEAVAKKNAVLEKSVAATKKEISLLTTEADRQKRALSEMERALEQATQEFGANSAEASKAQNAYNRQYKALADLNTKINNATTSLNKMEAELKDSANAADDAAGSMGDLDGALGGLGGGIGKLSGILGGGGLGGLLAKGVAVGAVVAGVKELGSALMGIVNDTQEYRTIMASLEVSSQNAGYTAEETAATYSQLYSVIGDQQAAATAAANLQAIGLSQEQLTEITNAAIGAWATYGDSIPIDGLSEAINETVQAGQVTGSFADVLNWAGLSEDVFNAKLAAANSETERANMVLDVLAKQGLTEAGEAWRENNKDITAMNEATAAMDEQMARLGELLSPLAAGFISFGADALEFVIDKVKSVVEWFGSMIDKVKAGIDAVKNFFGASDGVDGSHAGGLSYVPFDGYIAELHQGERVLTRAENMALKSRMIQPQPGLSTVGAGIVNGIQTAVAGASGGSYTINLVLPDGQVLARYQLPALIEVARANGTPILNPT